MKKLTILVPEDLLRKATQATRVGATPTVRMGLKLLAAYAVMGANQPLLRVTDRPVCRRDY